MPFAAACSGCAIAWSSASTRACSGVRSAMSREADLERARAYLLGAVDERDGDLLEEAYFRSAEALETVEAAEEGLIEDYLSDGLTGAERERFERHYLATPARRTRVETIRRLTAAARRLADSGATRGVHPPNARTRGGSRDRRWRGRLDCGTLTSA